MRHTLQYKNCRELLNQLVRPEHQLQQVQERRLSLAAAALTNAAVAGGALGGGGGGGSGGGSGVSASAAGLVQFQITSNPLSAAAAAGAAGSSGNSPRKRSRCSLREEEEDEIVEKGEKCKRKRYWHNFFPVSKNAEMYRGLHRWLKFPAQTH